MKLVLASGSPRRAEILRGLGFDVEVHPAGVPEDPVPAERPETHTERLARRKAAVGSERFPGRWVLAGDTVVADGEAVLGKPVDAEDAVRMLLRLQGKVHRVVSALALAPPAGDLEPASPVPGASPDPAGRIRSGVETTAVSFRPFGRALAEAYVRTGEPMDKAGAYGIQGKGAALVSRIEGDYTAVVGLPVPLLVRLLEEAGCPYRFGGR